ncbi:MAG: PrpF family protein [Alphaproteobacteria bacterium]|nr:PrpF family protein [Alphaproteobacteria bacterium]
MAEPQTRIPAAFMRGGTSNALVFHRRDLPPDPDRWDDIFLAAIGSPDPYGRQLDGMGGGISSLSKVVVVGPPTREDADIDYTFGQIVVDRPLVDYSANCGNMSSAVGPFAVDEGLVAAVGATARVRIHNTNTGKIVVSEFPLQDGRAAVAGDYALPGVAGSGARIRLSFEDPGGAATGRLLPTGRARDAVEVPGIGAVEVSLVDATNACVFVAASALGLAGTELPAALEADGAAMRALEAIRAAGAVAMGLAPTAEAAAGSPSSPKVALVSPPRAAATLAGDTVDADAMDLAVRMISLARPHRAVPLTGAMCLAVAARIGGTVAAEAARRGGGGDLRIAHPSGTIELAAEVRNDGDWHAERVVVYRTARRLMEGSVLIPARPAAAAAARRREGRT